MIMVPTIYACNKTIMWTIVVQDVVIYLELVSKSSFGLLRSTCSWKTKSDPQYSPCEGSEYDWLIYLLKLYNRCN